MAHNSYTTCMCTNGLPDMYTLSSRASSVYINHEVLYV